MLTRVIYVTILITGLGDLGSKVLEFLARTPGIGKIVTADVNEDSGIRKTNRAVLGAAHQGFYPHIEFAKVDLFDIEKTAETIKIVDPSVIFNASTLFSWWMVEKLSSKTRERVMDAGLGPWLPMHLTLVHKLMRAVRKSGVKAMVVNASYPDATNAVLNKVDLTPTVGVGNIDLLIPRIQKIIADKFKIPLNNVSVFLIAHHFHVVALRRFADFRGAPYYLKVLVEDKNVTSKLDIKDLLFHVGKLPLPGGAEIHTQVASSAVKNILAILHNTGQLTHAPGPKGLPGGYPVRLNSSGVEVIVPDMLSIDDAVRMNEEAQKFDGIESIEEDGTVTFTDKSTKIMKESLDYDCEQMEVTESEDRAKELYALVQKTN